MKSFRKFFTVFFAIMIIATIALTGCSSTNDENQVNNEEQPKETKTLKVAFGMGETEWELFRNEILPAFEQETGIKIEAIELKQEDLINSLTAQVESGNITIDMFAQDVNSLSSLVTRDLVEDLSAYKDRIPETVIPGMMEVSEFDGKLLFLPYRPNVEITFYNEAKFNEYGLEVPKTWDELLEVAKALKEKTGQGRVAIKANLQGDNILHMFDFIKAAGGDPYVLNDEGSIKAFEFMQELYPYLSEQSTTANWDTMNKYLEKDSVYLGANWPFYIPQFYKNGKEEIKAYSGWSGPVKESHALGGEVIGIPKGSKKVEEAIKFAEYLMSKPVQELLVSELAWPAVRSDAYGLVKGYQKPYFEAIKNALNYAEPRGNKPYWSDAEKIYLDAFQKAVINGEDVKTVLNEAAKKLEELKK
ncbi:sugar ABC transporter substrate-binding protein [Vulcanibacillus modesticaldus]|uniref:Sugar ABC transporter substrate-binding protein n=1 Tax=Vulcanibacillus modesticaldus TaxID=337097 RepID=A0A1D2YWJ1_9BACI|nr:extracellular solute-binding protein [Vulcanibacillus modesticaldus]OEG00121.1 sugar ABC transporter substrate-binding protein [Vulcanibacillus modesticaldus]